jgi:S-adenosylmethionine:tRNA ribosyltransferase-isomerase
VKTADYDFDLPDSLIARYPAEARDGSRLMVLNRSARTIRHHMFSDLPEFLRADDVLVSNDTKVLKARLWARKPTGGKVELLLVAPVDGARSWRAMATGSRALRPNMQLRIDEELSITVLENEGAGFITVKLPCDVEDLTEKSGQIPLPPYLGRPSEALDEERYQTIFASNDQLRSVAAPTAGLHFTPNLMAKLKDKGIQHTTVSLDVGPGTFMPVRDDDLCTHKMHLECFEVNQAAVERIQASKRVVAVGTTVVRSLESLDALAPKRSSTRLFIHPGFEFQYVDVMLTNFHLPRSTLLMLVSAFADRTFILEAYAQAVQEAYRFFSYGDAMLIL